MLVEYMGMVEVYGANSSSIGRGEATTQRAFIFWQTQAIPSSSRMNVPSALSSRCLSGPNHIGKNLNVDVSSYHRMNKLRPALKGAHTTNKNLFLGTLGKDLLELLRMILLECDMLAPQSSKQQNLALLPELGLRLNSPMFFAMHLVL